jgi:hypothetical protein
MRMAALEAALDVTLAALSDGDFSRLRYASSSRNTRSLLLDTGPLCKQNEL